ncbi:MAG TPA: GRP family sugar transporter [Terriglobia bacterium]|nr:GRP family sugar transporter [Terriglobia bacterium]
MSISPGNNTTDSGRSLHKLGIVCGLAAGAWLGAAEAPTKLVTIGVSPFLISLGMVTGVFVARWTLPMALKGTSYILLDLREKAHLVVWALLAGMLWAVANTLTVLAIRDVGLSIAFPLWNTNSLVGLFWGWLLFNELRNAGRRRWVKVLGGATAILIGGCLLAYATSHQSAVSPERASFGILASLGAGLLWGTMYIPYRKAYISGMNPLSFVTVFTFGELGTTLTLALVFQGGPGNLLHELGRVQSVLFWLFLGGFCWVIGDLFQQFAAKYIGIGRGIPLSNTNQLWGLAWGVLVFGELAGQALSTQILVAVGSLVMIGGAVAISMAEPSDSERASWRKAMERECSRYHLDPVRVGKILEGEDPVAKEASSRRWWELLVVTAALGIFIWLAAVTHRHPIPVNLFWIFVLSIGTLTFLVGSGVLLWRQTRFS